MISAQLDDMVARNQIAAGRDAIVKAAKNVNDTEKAANGEDEAEVQAKRRQKHLEDFAAQQLGSNYNKRPEEEREKIRELINVFEHDLEFNYLTGDKKDESDLDDKQLEDIIEQWNKNVEEAGLKNVPVPALITNEIKRRESNVQQEKAAQEERKKAQEKFRNDYIIEIAEERFDYAKDGRELEELLEKTRKIGKQFGDNDEQLKNRLKQTEQNFKVAKYKDYLKEEDKRMENEERRRRAEKAFKDAEENPVSFYYEF